MSDPTSCCVSTIRNRAAEGATSFPSFSYKHTTTLMVIHVQAMVIHVQVMMPEEAADRPRRVRMGDTWGQRRLIL